MKLSVVILAKNEEEMIKDCLESVKWVDEIVLVDTGSTDKTLEIAKKYEVKIIKVPPSKEKNYSLWRNKGLKAAQGSWLLYLDADERITSRLKREIQSVIESNGVAAYAVPRRNFLFGKEFHWGGWSPDYVERLFQRDKLKHWRGKVHEEAVFKGKLGYLKEPMIHLQPESIEPMFEKSIDWSEIEAELLYEAHHPPVVWWRILRMGLTTLFDRLIKKQAFRDGTEGWIQSVYQAFHAMIVYIQLWERQQKNDQ